jgi:hypothetical protein
MKSPRASQTRVFSASLAERLFDRTGGVIYRLSSRFVGTFARFLRFARALALSLLSHAPQAAARC